MVGNGRNSKTNKCNVVIPILARHIILGSDVLDYSINLACVINILKRTYETEIQSASFYQNPAIIGRIVKTGEAIKIILVLGK